jgi:hypothetical protein
MVHDFKIGYGTAVAQSCSMGNFIRQIHVDGQRNASMWCEYDPSEKRELWCTNRPTEKHRDPSGQRDRVNCIWRCNAGSFRPRRSIFCVRPIVKWEAVGLPMSRDCARDHRNPAFLHPYQISLMVAHARAQIRRYVLTWLSARVMSQLQNTA